MAKLCDYIWKYIAQQGVKHVFMVPGGGCMHLVDSLGQSDIEYVNCLHEQAAGMAAEAYAQFNGLGVCLVTTGPGGTNAITACASAWCNSMPVLFISGQVNTHQMKTPEQRFNGNQELDIISMVKPITKIAATLDWYDMIMTWDWFRKVIISSAVELAQQPRQGPVWLDIPLDVQAAEL